MSKHRTRGTMRNRLLSGVLCLALVLGLLPTAGLIRPADAASWADPYGEQLVEWGVMTPSMASNLGAVITRAEFVAMCNRAFGYKRLGSMPFTDVNVRDWYYEDINIAYNAGYFSGTSSTTASPNGTLTREMAAVAVARNLVLQETVGESLGFTDSRDLKDWSRGLIGAAVAQGVITGFSDGSFRPRNNITRGEVAALLVRLIGTPINKAGSYELGDVYGNVVISSSNVTLRDTTIAGNLYVTGGVDLGNVLLENVDVLGQIVICGGGESHTAQSSVVLLNVRADEMLVDSIIDQFVTISAYGITDIPVTNVRTNAYLEDACEAGHGLHLIELNGKNGSRTMLQLAGDIKEVVNKAPFSDLQLVKGTAQKITVDEYAKGSEVRLSEGTLVYEMNLDVATLVTGKGDIKNLNIWAAGCEVDMLPENVTIRPGITAIVDGKVIGDLEAAELSSEPRLLAGYPDVVNIAPTQAEGLFAANKPGTIYWAISEVAKGSVDPDDLIHNPVYGGNIFKEQAGNISASSKTEYGRLIANLAPDGSYYLSAILVDGRGIMSPLKVTAFTTPDNTVPAFVKGYPYMSRVTCETAQVAAMPNKNCQLYYALLPAGADAPTPQQFESASIGGNYGYGSVSVVKNVPVYITVNRSTLQEKTTYWLYLWLTDYNGAQKMDAPVRLEFTTPDETPPVVTRIEQTNFDLPDAVEFSFAINEAPSTLYWAVVKESNNSWISPDADMNSRTIQNKVVNGSKTSTDVFVSGSKAAIGADEDTLVEAKDFAGKLKYESCKTHNFKLWYVAKDADGNYSEVKYIIIHTKDTEPPIVTQSFSDAQNNTPEDLAAGKKPRPRAGSNITLTFSEQVTGSTRDGAMTFVDLYNEVVKYQDVGGFALEAAKKALADELKAHITLYYMPINTTERPDPLNELKTNPHGWVDWGNAVVTLESNGTVKLTLYGSGENQAVSLGSGMTYYFHFENVYDNSHNHNRLAVTDDKGNIIDGGGDDWICELEPFTTVYAQVTLEDKGERAVIVPVKGGDAGGGDEEPGDGDEGGDEDEGPAGDTVYMDVIVAATPQSTRNMAADIYWDMIIWSDTVMTVDIYRQVLDKKDESKVIEDWTQVWDDVTLTGIDPTTELRDGFSLGNKKLPDARYDRTVQGGLSEDCVYRYGIHITHMGDNLIKRDNHEKRPESWSADINLEFSLIAGEETQIDNVARAVNSRYKSDVEDGKVSVISVSTVREGGTTKERETLLVNRTYSDTQGPSFRSGYPQLTPGSGSIVIDVALDHAGTVYYMVAPVGEVLTSIDGKTLINSDNDNLNGTPKPSKNRKTYIPTGGADASANKNLIHFMTGGETGGPGQYAEPNYVGIYRETAGGGKDSVQYGNRYVSSPQSPVSITVKKLDPLTDYYVYIVLKSDDGIYDKVVQIYRTKTLKAEPPAVVINAPGGTDATITSWNIVNNKQDGLYDNPELYYALWDSTALPSVFTQKIYTEDVYAEGADKSKDDPLHKAGDVYTPTDDDDDDPAGVMTVVAAMMKLSGSTQRNLFDMVASDDTKMEVTRYIKGTNPKDEEKELPIYRSTRDYSDGVTDNPWPEDFKDRTDASTAEYYLFACVKNAAADDKGEYWGFAAGRGLVNRDMEPPSFKANPDHPRYLLLEGKQSNNSSNTVWSGYVTVSFDKNVFYQPQTTGGRSKLTITYEDNKTGTDGTISLKGILGGSAILSKHAEPGSTTGTVYDSITLKIDKIRDSETIEFFVGGWICSENNVSTKSKVKLEFKSSLKASDVGAKEIADPAQPGFVVTWG